MGNAVGAAPESTPPERRALLDRFGLITEQELACLCAVSVPTVQRWRSIGIGPTPTKLGERSVAYTTRHVEAWLGRQAEALRPGGSK